MKGRFIRVFGAVMILIALLFTQAYCEETKVTVLVDQLNGRLSPSKGAHREAMFDRGDILTATGKWSKDHKWIEVKGGESGTVWCDIRYLSERTDTFMITNYGNTAVKIRSRPVNGKVTGYLKKGKYLEVTQEILGWGKTDKGWIDLSYVIEE